MCTAACTYTHEGCKILLQALCAHYARAFIKISPNLISAFEVARLSISPGPLFGFQPRIRLFALRFSTLGDGVGEMSNCLHQWLSNLDPKAWSQTKTSLNRLFHFLVGVTEKQQNTVMRKSNFKLKKLLVCMKKLLRKILLANTVSKLLLV